MAGRGACGVAPLFCVSDLNMFAALQQRWDVVPVRNVVRGRVAMCRGQLGLVWWRRELRLSVMRRRLFMRAGQVLSDSECLGGRARVSAWFLLYWQRDGANRVQRRRILVPCRVLLANGRAVLARKLRHDGRREHLLQRRVRGQLRVSCGVLLRRWVVFFRRQRLSAWVHLRWRHGTGGWCVGVVLSCLLISCRKLACVIVCVYVCVCVCVCACV